MGHIIDGHLEMLIYLSLSILCIRVLILLSQKAPPSSNHVLSNLSHYSLTILSQFFVCSRLFLKGICRECKHMYLFCLIAPFPPSPSLWLLIQWFTLLHESHEIGKPSTSPSLSPYVQSPWMVMILLSICFLSFIKVIVLHCVFSYFLSDTYGVMLILSNFTSRMPIKKVGAFTWVSVAICVVEVLICIKFGQGMVA